MVKPTKWQVVEKARNVHEFRLEGIKSGAEGWLLWMSDEHWDHPKCRLDVLKAHHNEAVARGALIVKVGDTFCAMQGKGDPRGDKDSVRAEHLVGDYLDALVKTAADWYAPWKDNIALIGLGNHETAVYKNKETCLIERLVQSLRNKGGIARKGGYSGWVRAMFARHKARFSHRIFYHHGYGGGGPVTKGSIDFNRVAEYVDADSYVMGHVHWKNQFINHRMRLTDASVLVMDPKFFVRLSTYKDEYEDGFAGFHVEKGRAPRVLGGWWQRLAVKRDRIEVEWTEAKA